MGSGVCVMGWAFNAFYFLAPNQIYFCWIFIFVKFLFCQIFIFVKFLFWEIFIFVKFL